MDPHRFLVTLLSISILISAVQSICVPIGSSPITPAASPVFTPTPRTNSPSGGDSPLTEIAGSIGDLVHSVANSNPIASNIDPQLMTMCNSTDYSELCITTLLPLLSGKNDADSVIRMAVKAAADYTQLALLAAEKFGDDPTIPKKLESIISDCRDSYRDALDNFQEALVSLPKKDSGTMNSMLSAAITDFSDIDDFLDGYGDTPLPEFNQKLVKLTSNCLAIVSFCYPSNYDLSV